MFSSDINLPLHLQYVNYDIFDHKIIFIEIEGCNNYKPNYQNIECIKINTDSLRTELINDPLYLRDSSVDNLYDRFIDHLKQKTDICKKLKTVKQDPSKPWLNSDLANCYSAKNFWYKKYNKDRSNSILRSEYVYWRNRCTNDRRKNKLNYFQNKFKKNEKCPKKSWQTIKEVIYDGKPPNKQSSLLNNFSNTSNKIAELNKLNDHFCNVGLKLSSTFTSNFNYIPRLSNCSFKFAAVNRFEVLNTINGLNNSTSIAFDGIPTYVFKQCSDLCADNLTFIFNKSLNEGVVPKNLKISKTVPIHKTGSVYDHNNYRPISLLPTVDKILESLVLKQLNTYMINNNILSKHQYGFRKNSGTNTALFDITSEIQLNRDNKKIVCCIFIDLTKAFDALDRNLLLKKLLSIGIRGIEFEWFNSYLMDRKQYT